MAQFNTPTEQELHEQYVKMLLILDEPAKLESFILAKGRTEMHHLLAYLVSRCVLLEIDRFKLISEAVNAETQA